MVFLSVLAVSTLLGAWRGLVYEMLSLAGWVAAFFAAKWLAPLAANWLPVTSLSDSLRYAAGFVMVFVVAMFAAGLVSFLVKKLIESAGLRPVDRTLGAGFGLLRGALLLLAATAVIAATPLQNSPWWTESAGKPMLEAALTGVKPLLPEQFARHLN